MSTIPASTTESVPAPSDTSTAPAAPIDTPSPEDRHRKGEHAWHAAAALFPMMAASDLEALAADIKANGQREPILLDAKERIIDGRNRERACLMAGRTPKCKNVHPSAGRVQDSLAHHLAQSAPSAPA